MEISNPGPAGNVDYKIQKTSTAPAICHPLTLQHSGTGYDPYAYPDSSAGCASGYYTKGEIITIIPIPAVGYHVDHWDGTDSPSSNKLHMPPYARTVTAYYVQDSGSCYTLTTTSSPAAGGSVSPSLAANCAGGKYTSGTVVTLTANPNSAYVFGNWSGDASGASNPTQVIMNGNKSVTANFTAIPCYYLTLAYTGSGSAPTASPANSSACSTGYYTAGQSITLSAHPGLGYHLDQWAGTDSSSSNHLSMPSGPWTATANYVVNPPTCYLLTLQHSGSGSNPTASPPNSSGCSAGYYTPGESINLTEHPAGGYHLDYWEGTDSSFSNHLTMAAGPWSATAYYVVNPPTCYPLTLQHNGSGSDPTASPTNSSGCSAGYYTAGESINLTAAPAAGYHLDQWAGTDSSSSNHLSMPAGPWTATAYYVVNPPTCYQLILQYFGTGSNPKASPLNSSGCSAGWYTAGESITLTGHPAAGYHLDHWTGTDSASSNHLSMPAGTWTVAAYYVVN